MDLELRTIKEDELRQFLEAAEAAFGETITDQRFNLSKEIVERDRSLAFFDDRAIVATTGAYSFELTVPGAMVPAAGVTLVGVLPTHRRSGLLTTMMIEQLKDVMGRREPVAILWASEDAIYRRFGYGLATAQALFDIEREHAALLDDIPSRGKLRLVGLEDATDAVASVYETVRARTPGMYARSDTWWRNHTLADPESDRRGGPLLCAVLELDGKSAGYALYRIHAGWERGTTASRLEVKEALAMNAESEHALWSYLFGIDLIKSIVSEPFFIPLDHPLVLMLQEARRLHLTLSNGLWLRVVDVAAALQARSYATDGSVVFSVSDSLFEDNAGVWRLEAASGAGRATREPARPELAFAIQELGAVYLGGFSFTQLARAGRVQELVPGALRRADELFRCETTPWCPEIF